MEQLLAFFTPVVGATTSVVTFITSILYIRSWFQRRSLRLQLGEFEATRARQEHEIKLLRGTIDTRDAEIDELKTELNKYGPR